MSPMDYITLMIGSFAAIGGLFFWQYRLATSEKRWKTFMIPVLLLIIYLSTSTGVMIFGNQYTVKELSSVDRFGNQLELTIQAPVSGNGYAASFSTLRIYDADHVLLDEIGLYYEDNLGLELRQSKSYNKDVMEMLQGIKLDGRSQALNTVREEISLFGITLPHNPYRYFAVPFGISIVLLLSLGFIARALQARNIRRRSMSRIDIQSFEPPM
jgi:hypothetical protein